MDELEANHQLPVIRHSNPKCRSQMIRWEQIISPTINSECQSKIYWDLLIENECLKLDEYI